MTKVHQTSFMNTKKLFMSSALFLALFGLALTFASQELMATTTVQQAFVGQLLGAALCGFALLNWMSKGTVMGGIYGRPLAMGNLVHFTIGGLALLKMAGQLQPAWLFMTLAICYLVFAALFARAAFFTSGPPTP